jgi:hypothetical protein
MADHLHRENRRTSPAFHVASATFPGQACDEKPFIEQVTRSVGFQSSYWNGNIPSGREFLRPSVDLPGASICFNGGSVGDLEISKAIGARVILSGEAGDFVTGENGLFNELLVQHKWSRILSQILSAESPKDRAGRLRSLRVVMREEASPSVLRIWKGLHPFRASEPAPNWLRGDLGALWGDPEFGRAPRLGIGSSRLQQRSWDYLRWSRLGWSVDFFGCYTADAGVEARYPFLDSRLVSFMLALPVEQRLMAGLRRWLHRRALRDVLPDGISRRSSKPVFNGAVVRWGHASLAPIREMLEGQEWRSGRFVEQREARKLFDSLSSRPQDAADRKGWIHVRAIVNIEAWHRAVFGYARMKETLAMSEIRTISESTRPREEDGRSPSTQPYEAPKLTSVGNVRSFLADGSSSGDDASGGNPLLSALP